MACSERQARLFLLPKPKDGEQSGSKGTGVGLLPRWDKATGNHGGKSVWGAPWLHPRRCPRGALGAPSSLEGGGTRGGPGRVGTAAGPPGGGRRGREEAAGPGGRRCCHHRAGTHTPEPCEPRCCSPALLTAGTAPPWAAGRRGPADPAHPGIPDCHIPASSRQLRTLLSRELSSTASRLSGNSAEPDLLHLYSGIPGAPCSTGTGTRLR